MLKRIFASVGLVSKLDDVTSIKEIEDFANKANYSVQGDKLYVTVRALSAIVNLNFDGFTREELLASHKTFEGKPVFVEHDNMDDGKARGRIVAAEFEDDKEHGGVRQYACVNLLLEIDQDKYPLLANAIKEQSINTVSMGCDVEYSICSVCGHKAYTERDYCAHILNKGYTYIVEGKEVLAYEDNRGIDFFEISFVKNPADETAQRLAKVASKIEKMSEDLDWFKSQLIAQFGNDTDAMYADLNNLEKQNGVNDFTNLIRRFIDEIVSSKTSRYILDPDETYGAGNYIRDEKDQQGTGNFIGEEEKQNKQSKNTKGGMKKLTEQEYRRILASRLKRADDTTVGPAVDVVDNKSESACPEKDTPKEDDKIKDARIKRAIELAQIRTARLEQLRQNARRGDMKYRRQAADGLPVLEEPTVVTMTVPEVQPVVAPAGTPVVDGGPTPNNTELVDLEEPTEDTMTVPQVAPVTPPKPTPDIPATAARIEARLMKVFTLADKMVEKGLIQQVEKPNKIAELRTKSVEELDAQEDVVDKMQTNAPRKSAGFRPPVVLTKRTDIVEDLEHIFQ